MAYEPQFAIRPRLLALVESIAALRERILGASVELSWIPALQKDTRTRNGHASTAIEGNPLTLEQVRALEEGRPLAASDQRSQREVLNYFAGLRYVEKHAKKKAIRHDDLFELHRILADTVMDQGTAGNYRTISVRVGKHMPPPATDVSGLMFELLEWWNKRATELSPVLSSAILHYRFEDIHPFADGNGRTARIMMNAELVAAGEERIVVPTVFRSHYLSALKALSQNGRAEPLIRMLDFAQKWTAAIDWRTVEETRRELDACNAFLDPAVADEEGKRLRMPERIGA